MKWVPVTQQQVCFISAFYYRYIFKFKKLDSNNEKNDFYELLGM